MVSVYKLMVIIYLAFSINKAFCQMSSWSNIPLLYDADRIDTLQNGAMVVAHGDVFILFGDTFASAQKVIYYKKTKVIEIDGKVHLLRANQILQAKRVVIDLNHSKATYEDLVFVQDPLFLKEQASKIFLEVSASEVAFEKALLEQETKIENELKNDRNIYRNINTISRFKIEGASSEEIISKYSQNLQRLYRLKNRKINILNSNEETWKILKRRREAASEYARAYPEAAGNVWQKTEFPFYSMLSAKKVYQYNDGRMELQGASISPCRCGPHSSSLGSGLPPIFRFSGVSSQVEPNEYLWLTGASIDIVNVPVAYLPWLVIPIKNKRQSGLLFPSFYINQKQNAFSQPLYITLGDHADTTLKGEFFSKKGYRFGQEFNFKIYENSEFKLWGDVAQDNDYNKQVNTHYKQTSETVATKGIENNLELKLNEPKKLSKRWSVGGSWNLPLHYYGALKLNGNWVSDNKYQYDYAMLSDAKSDLFAKPPDIKRFLEQEATVEYYGDNQIVSVSAFGLKDSMDESERGFSLNLPRIDWHILPRPLWSDAFVSHYYNVSWQRIQRIQTKYGYDTITVTSPSGQEEKTPLSLNRGLAKGNLLFPFIYNSYINAWSDVGFYLLTYDGIFSTENSFHKSPLQAQKWVDMSLNVDVPLFSELELGKWGLLRQNLTPQSHFTYIPWVERTKDFPTTYQLLYTKDNMVEQKTLTLQISSEWSLVKGKTTSSAFLTSAPNSPAPDSLPVANEELLEVSDKLKLRQMAHSYDGDGDLEDGFWNKWARIELDHFVDFTRNSLQGQNLKLPTAEDWSWRFFWMHLASKYNFESQKLEKRLNSRLSLLDKPKSVPPWDKVELRAGLEGAPFVPISLLTELIWMPAWQHFEKQSYTATTHIWGGVTGRFQTATTFEKKEIGNGFYKTVTQGFGVDWVPINWLRFRYQRNNTVNPLKTADAKRPHREFEYESIQEISLTNIQECLDIVLKRQKKLLKFEYEADYFIGVNMSFFGQQRSIEQIGERINHRIKDLAKANH